MKTVPPESGCRRPRKRQTDKEENMRKLLSLTLAALFILGLAAVPASRKSS
ncbi:MAG: hypothetical protein GX623_08210 [Clostridiales bacterium]|nr:hypothetical protein [Clostridiales bacterium]